MGKARGAGDGGPAQPHEFVLSLDQFTWEALVEEAQRLGVSSEELASYALLYYLADLDSGRIARRLPDTLALR